MEPLQRGGEPEPAHEPARASIRRRERPFDRLCVEIELEPDADGRAARAWGLFLGHTSSEPERSACDESDPPPN